MAAQALMSALTIVPSKIFVEVTAPAAGGAGIGSVVNVQVLGDTDIV